MERTLLALCKGKRGKPLEVPTAVKSQTCYSFNVVERMDAMDAPQDYQLASRWHRPIQKLPCCGAGDARREGARFFHPRDCSRGLPVLIARSLGASYLAATGDTIVCDVRAFWMKPGIAGTDCHQLVRVSDITCINLAANHSVVCFQPFNRVLETIFLLDSLRSYPRRQGHLLARLKALAKARAGAGATCH